MQISGFQLEIAHCILNQEDLKLKEKRSVEANTKMTEIYEFFDKHFRTGIVKILQ